MNYMVTCEQKKAQMFGYKKEFEVIRTSHTPPIKTEMKTEKKLL